MHAGADQVVSPDGSKRFFDIDVFAGLHGIDGLSTVLMVWRGDDDGVDLVVFEQSAVIAVGFRL